MHTKIRTSFSVIYFIVVIDTIICSYIESLMPMYYYTKPAILTLLIIYFWVQSGHLNKNTRNITLLALICSLIGDVLLMFVDRSPNFFIGGLIAFLVAHLMYIKVFLKSRNKTANHFPIILMLLIYAFGVLYYIKDGLNQMFIPVLVYLIVILIMGTTAFLRNKSKTNNSYSFILVGAIFFIISDSLLAIDKFHKPLEFSSVSIILTYALAQYCIATGILKQSD